MKILVINCGSSSIKYKLFDFPGEKFVDKGVVENIGESVSRIKNHTQGIDAVIEAILDSGKMSDLKEIKAVGHRVVHGGEKFKSPSLINKAVLRQIEKCIDFAPLHNPANLAGIKHCLKIFPASPQVAVFDTAFHQTVPEEAFIYPIPYLYYRKYKIRKYGFHGTSHQFVSQKASEALKKPLGRLKLITVHLGNGCSISAIDRGKSIATSMGFTPLEGLMMGTRSGDIDVAAVFNIMKKEKLNLERMDQILNKKSGFLGVSGVSNDFRAVKKAAKSGNSRAELAIKIFIHRIKEYVGSYLFILGKLDALCFTGGIGENNPDIAQAFKENLKKVAPGAKILTIPTDEERMIAKLAFKLLQKTK